MSLSSRTVMQPPRTNSQITPARHSDARHPLSTAPGATLPTKDSPRCADCASRVRRCVRHRGAMRVVTDRHGDPRAVPVQVLSGASQKLHAELRPLRGFLAVARHALHARRPRRPRSVNEASTTRQRSAHDIAAGTEFHHSAAAGTDDARRGQTARATSTAPHASSRRAIRPTDTCPGPTPGCPPRGHMPRPTPALPAPEPRDSKRFCIPRRASTGRLGRSRRELRRMDRAGTTARMPSRSGQVAGARGADAGEALR